MASQANKIIPFETKVTDFRGQLQAMIPQLRNALPRHVRPEQFARVVLTTVRKVPKILDCTPESVMGSIVTAAQLGLEPDGVLGEAHLVPYGTECQLIVGYQGFIKLAWQSGQIDDVYAEIAYKNDYFKYHLGTRRRIVHRPAEGDRGEPTHVYGVARIKGGGSPFVVMTIAEVHRIRERSRAKGGPWTTDYEAMVRKTAIRQLQKWIPKSKEQARAAALDELADANLSQEMGSVIDVPAAEPEATDAIKGPPRTLDDLARNTGHKREPFPASDFKQTPTSGHKTPKPIQVEIVGGENAGTVELDREPGAEG